MSDSRAINNDNTDKNHLKRRYKQRVRTSEPQIMEEEAKQLRKTDPLSWPLHFSDHLSGGLTTFGFEKRSESPLTSHLGEFV